MSHCSLLIFDLDGVVVDTARFHYLAWLQIALELGIAFTPGDNEKLKGVSRMESLEILLGLGQRALSPREKLALAEKKNNIYTQYLEELSPKDCLPGVVGFIAAAREAKTGTALASASKNTHAILKKLNIESCFDRVIDGTMVIHTKPAPDCFILAQAMVPADECIVFEDSIAGIEAATSAGMCAVGIGKPEVLSKAHFVMPGFVPSLAELKELSTLWQGTSIISPVLLAKKLGFD